MKGLGADMARLLSAITPEREREIAAERAAQERRASAERADRDRRRLASWGAPARAVEYALRLGDLKRTDALAAVRDWPARRSILILGGNVGRGKTTAAVWWLWNGAGAPGWVRSGPPRFVTADELRRASAFGDDSPLAEYESASRLVIDDLGVEYADSKGAWSSRLDALIDARYRSLRPTVITTNMLLEEFRGDRVDPENRRHSERILSRLREAGDWIEVGGEDLRSRRAK